MDSAACEKGQSQGPSLSLPEPVACGKTLASSLGRSIRLSDAVSMLVGNILGSGIFVAPAAIAACAPTLAQAALFWALGAFVAGCGALCYVECGTRMPQDGGFFVFFEEAFDWRWAFVAGWAALLVSYPASLAGMAIMAAGYWAEALKLPKDQVTRLALLLVSLAAVANVFGIGLSRLVQRVLTIAKALALLAVVAAAAWVAAPDANGAGGGAQVASHLAPGGLLMALATLMWTYDGWSDITMVAGEVQNPERNLARAVGIALMVLLALYVAVQAAVMHILGVEANQHAQVFAAAIARALGPKGSQAVAWLVVLTCAGSLPGVLFAASRLAWAMGQRGALPQSLGHIGQWSQAPYWAVALVWLLSCGYVVSGSFDDLLGTFALIIWLFYGATAFAVFRMRQRARLHQGPDSAPSQALGHIGPPVVLLLAASGMTLLQLIEAPRRGALGVSLFIVGRMALSMWSGPKSMPPHQAQV